MRHEAGGLQVDRESVFGEKDGDFERIAPGFFDGQVESEHLARYRWAATFAVEKNTLDAASGTGYGSRLLSDMGARNVVSLDLSLPALTFSRRVYGSAAVCGDVERLPIRDSAVDVVASMETIEHLAEPGTLLNEFHRVLKPGGSLLLSTPNSRYSAGQNPYHSHELDLDELLRCLATAGFEVDSIYGQCWRFRWGWMRRVRGIRRLAYELESAAEVRTQPPGRSMPLIWCLRATRGKR
jgi:2-polyprenyl-3-methyl-5-hydroxy-6-metoxy-1,4-benzoquinol methylase